MVHHCNRNYSLHFLLVLGQGLERVLAQQPEMGLALALEQVLDLELLLALEQELEQVLVLQLVPMPVLAQHPNRMVPHL